MQLLILLVRLIFATFSQRGINHDILAVQSMKEEKKKKKEADTPVFAFLANILPLPFMHLDCSWPDNYPLESEKNSTVVHSNTPYAWKSF